MTTTRLIPIDPFQYRTARHSILVWEVSARDNTVPAEIGAGFWSPAGKVHKNWLAHGQQHAVGEYLPDGSHLAEAGVVQRRHVEVESGR